jgi:hypothetical protein
MSGLLLGTVGVRPALRFGFHVQWIPRRVVGHPKLARNGIVGKCYALHTYHGKTGSHPANKEN